jgi:hypothetical protein
MDPDAEGVGDPAPPILGGPRRAGPAELDHEALATDLTEVLDRQAVLAGQQDDGRGVARGARDDDP